jgi:hypothetical protein
MRKLNLVGYPKVKTRFWTNDSFFLEIDSPPSNQKELSLKLDPPEI